MALCYKFHKRLDVIGYEISSTKKGMYVGNQVEWKVSLKPDLCKLFFSTAAQPNAFLQYKRFRKVC